MRRDHAKMQFFLTKSLNRFLRFPLHAVWNSEGENYLLSVCSLQFFLQRKNSSNKQIETNNVASSQDKITKYKYLPQAECAL